MPLTLIQEEVDIYCCPIIDERCVKYNHMEITIGDLHGNTIKLLYMLIRHGIVEKFLPSDYEILVAIYHLPIDALSEQNLITYKEMISGLKFNPHAPHIRLLGDECADRGSNDYFTLILFDAMHKAGVSFEIILSNHGIEFISAYEHYLEASRVSLPIQYAPQMMSDVFVKSLTNLIALINRGMIDVHMLSALIETSYKPHLKMVSYTRDEYDAHLSLFSHAPIDLIALKNLAILFGVDFIDQNVDSFIETLNKINGVFLDALMTNRMLNWYDKDDLDLLNMPTSSRLVTFEFMLWNRNYRYLHRQAQHDNGLKLHFVHGHDNGWGVEPHVTCLDNLLGKALDLNRGLYTVVYTNLPEKLILNEDNPAEVYGRFEVMRVSYDEDNLPTPRLHKSLTQHDFQAIQSEDSLFEIVSQMGIFVEVIRIENESKKEADDTSIILTKLFDHLSDLTYRYQMGQIKTPALQTSFLSLYVNHVTIIHQHHEINTWMKVYQTRLEGLLEKEAIVSSSSSSTTPLESSGFFKRPVVLARPKDEAPNLAPST